MTGDDFPNHIGLYLKDRHILARDRVRFVGGSGGRVAAVSEEIAEKAVGLIEVAYEPLEPVFDPEYGVSPAAPLIHPDLGNYSAPNFIFPSREPTSPTISKSAKGIRKRRGRIAPYCGAHLPHPHIQHVPIEPHIATPRWLRTAK
ncbi:MAG: hypothetical protein M5U34_38375 [Chloroflexi bacterium]|nr:hypothetical protein [Chloroflexota bacterium]